MIIKTKRRKIVQILDCLCKRKNLNQVGVFEFNEEVCRIEIGKYSRKAIGEKKKEKPMIIREYHKYLDYCIEEGYISKPFNDVIKLSSKGEKFLSPLYYFSKFFSHWTVQTTITAIISISLSAMVAYLVSKPS